jgi:predicted exporter
MITPGITVGMKLRALLWLLLAIGALAVCGVQFADRGRLPVQTNLLTLLPSTERNPVAEEAVGRLAEAAGDRAVFLIGDRKIDGAASAARAFSAQLRESGVFRNVVADIPSVNRNQLTAIYLKHRYSLLTEGDRQALASGAADLAGRMQQKLYAPFRYGLTLPSMDDPFGFTDEWLASLPIRNLRLEPEDGLLVARDAERVWVFVSAELAGSAYDGTLQHRVSTAVALAENSLRQLAPEAKLLRTGTVFYAAAARQSAEREVDMIGAGSLLGILLLLYLVFRSLRPLALGLLSVGFGIATAIAVTVAWHGEMHLITLVFGASLIGEAIDYAVQYFAAHLGAGQSWEPMVGLRRITPGLTIALATSLLGYGVLLLAPFPALSQIALFAFAGLCASWLSVFLLLPAFLARPSSRDAEVAVAGAHRLLVWWLGRMSKRRCVALAILLVIVAAPGWSLLSGNDDVHLLVTRSPELVTQEERLRELAGIGNSSQFFLVEGETPNGVLLGEEKLANRLNELVAKGEISGYQAVSSFVPSLERQQENRRLWQEQVFTDTVALKTLFAQSELKDDIANEQLAAFEASDKHYLYVDEWLQAPLSAPIRHLWLGKTTQGYAAIVSPQGVRDARLLAQVAIGLPGVTLVDKPGSVTRLFHDYRQWGALWLAGACALVYIVLCVRYRWRQAAVTLIPTLLSMAMVLGILGYLGTPFTLFNLMALMLVLGVGVNYAIFLREGGMHTASTLAGVLLSAGTTLLSFGLLAFSSMPALSSFGLTLLIGVGIAVLFAPSVLSFADNRNRT